MKSEAVGVLSREAFGATRLRWVVVGSLFALYYAPTVSQLVNDWRETSTFSYCFFVPIIAAYLVWRRWGEIRLTPVGANSWAALPLLMSIVFGLFGQAIGDTFSVRISMIFALASTLWLLFGTRMLQALWFPIFYLLLMIPTPYIFIKDLAYYLRYTDATFAAYILQLSGIPVYREAYFLYLPNITLEVADVCSGVSSIFALLALGVVYAYFLPIRLTLKALLIIGTVPFALAANLLRIVVTAILAYHFGLLALKSSFHAFNGTFTFTLALLMLLGAGETLRKRYAEFSPAPRRHESTAPPQGWSYAVGDPSTRAPALAGGSRSGFRPTGVVQGATGLPVGLHWSAFALGTAIFIVGLFASQQLVKPHRVLVRANLTTLAPVELYEAVDPSTWAPPSGHSLGIRPDNRGDGSGAPGLSGGLHDLSADSYNDTNAESSLSQTFIGQDKEIIKLFVGYRSEQTNGNRLRSPKVNFPNKWDFAWLKPAALPLDGTTSIHGNWMLARKGQARELILYWYQIGNRTYGGELENRIEQIRRLFFERRGDGAIVRIATSLRNDEPIEAAQKRLQGFGIRLYPELLRVLPL